MGIVDFQQLYNFEKKVDPLTHCPPPPPPPLIVSGHPQLERFFKVYFKGEPVEGLSCMEPVSYRSRFLRRMEELLELEEGV
jgi:hypothetical protein